MTSSRDIRNGWICSEQPSCVSGTGNLSQLWTTLKTLISNFFQKTWIILGNLPQTVTELAIQWEKYNAHDSMYGLNTLDWNSCCHSQQHMHSKVIFLIFTRLKTKERKWLNVEPDTGLKLSSLKPVITSMVTHHKECHSSHYLRQHFWYKWRIKPVILKYLMCWGTRWRSWLRHCATSRKVTGSIPNGFSGIFHWHNPSSRIMALGCTQPLTEMSTRNISWGGKGNRCVRLTTLPPSCAECLEIWEPQLPGNLRACPGL